jgi:hypothetical protein
MTIIHGLIMHELRATGRPPPAAPGNGEKREISKDSQRAPMIFLTTAHNVGIWVAVLLMPTVAGRTRPGSGVRVDSR